jgi:hypothetical protein
MTCPRCRGIIPRGAKTNPCKLCRITGEQMSQLSEVLAKRNAQVLAVTDEDRDEMDENNPVVFAESGRTDSPLCLCSLRTR